MKNSLSSRRSLVALCLAFVGLWSCPSGRGADGGVPAVVGVLPAPLATVSSAQTIQIFFSEPVLGVVVDDLLMNGNAATSATPDGTSWIFRYSTPPVGRVALSWDQGSDIRTAAGVRFVPPAEGWSYQYADTTAPEMTRLTPPSGTLLTRLDQVEVLFSEPVTGLQAGSLWINGQPAELLESLAPDRARFRFAPVPAGSVTVRWAPNHGLQDLQGNALADAVWSYVVDPALEIPSLRINEFIASNLSGLLDENSSPEDWIELHNPSSKVVNLSGWTLSNDRNDRARWTFPSTNIGPGGFLVVYASAKNRTLPGGRLHTNFKLNPTGGYLALFWNGQVASEWVDYPEQRGNFSYGFDSAQIARYFPSPTPGSANLGSSSSGIITLPHANVRRGLFDHPFIVYLSCDEPGVTLRYTLDGTEPSGANGLTYRGSFEVTNTTTLRFAAFKPGRLPSGTVTHTYLFLDSVLHQSNKPAGVPTGPSIWGGFPSDFEMDPEILTNAVYGPLMKDALKSLPALCLSIPAEEMFGASRGLYTHTDDRGPTWERACSVEWIPQEGSDGFQVNCGVQIQGNANRTAQKNPKHAMRLTFKGDYGPTSLNYPLFPDSPVTKFDTLVLRSDFNFGWLHWSGVQRLRGQRTRDAWMKDSMRAMGGLASHNRYCHLYINGLYWGIYDPTERPDAAFAAAYLGGEKEEWDIINEGLPVDGTMTAYNTMIGINSLQRETNYVKLQRFLDVPSYIDYILLHYYVGHQDWGDNKNWYTARPKSGASGFRYIPWDGENILDVDVNYNRVTGGDEPSSLQTKLIANSEYRIAFGDRVQKHLFNGGALTTNGVIDRWMKRARQVELAIVAESARWGDYRRDVQQYQDPPYELYTRDNQWRKEQDRLVTQYFPARGGILIKQLQAAGLYPKVPAPSFEPHGGIVPFNSLLPLSAPTGTVYLTLDGTDPRTYGTGTISSNAIAYSTPLTINRSLTLKARALVGTNWSALNEASFVVNGPDNPLRVTEIMFNPAGGAAYEFLEFQNLSADSLNVSGFSIQGVDYTFPPDTLLLSGQVLVLGSNESRTNWLLRYPGANPFGWFGGNLANGGERISLRDGQLHTIGSVSYGSGEGWPKEANGLGSSLEIIDVAGNPEDPANWRASAEVGGTPGRIVIRGTGASLRINEILAGAGAPEPSSPGFVELFNPGTSTIDLSGWTLTEDLSARSLQFPQGTQLASGAFLMIWHETNSVAPSSYLGFPLLRSGGRLRLLDSKSNRVDAFSYGPQAPGFSVGLTDTSISVLRPTPGAANLVASTAPQTTLVLNEWLANSRPGDADWVELFNTSSTQPVSLRDLVIETEAASYRYAWMGVIPARGFLRLWADEQPHPEHLGLKLAAAGGSLRISSSNRELIQRVDYGAQVEGVSEGRSPDGSSVVIRFDSGATPGKSNQIAPFSGPRLNEVLASNFTGLHNQAGRTADWIELWNPTGVPFDVSGFALRRSDSLSLSWSFPKGSVMPAGAFWLIWCDDHSPGSSQLGGEWNTGFALDASGSTVEWVTPAGQLIDRVAFGPQITDRSIGTNGATWELLQSPTPGAKNSVAATLGSVSELRINEWRAKSGGDDFIELFQANDAPASLSGLRLTDDPSLASSSASVRELPPLSFIAGRGYATLYPDGHPERGPAHLDFRLDGSGESLRLLDRSLAVLDAVYFGDIPQGFSMGRLPDGLGPQVLLNQATPGLSNQGPLTLSESPRSIEVTLGSTATFSVVAATLQPPLTYQWRHDGAALSGATSSTLLLPSVQEAMEGFYSVVVADQNQSVESQPATLTIWKPAKFLVQPPPVLNVATGATFNVGVTTAGTLPIRYRWFRGTVELTNLALDSNLSTLTITNTKANQAGRYFCVVSNLATSGSLTSAVAVVNVLVPPVLLSQPVGAEGDLGGQVTLSVLTAGTSPSFGWSQNGVLLPNATNSSLTLTNLQQETLGFYSVLVTNAVGMVRSAEVRVTLRGAPVLSIEPQGEKLLLRWTTLARRTYQLQFSDQLNAGTWINLADPIQGDGAVALIQDRATSGTRYYRVILKVAP